MSNKAGIGTLVNEEHELGTSALDLFTSPPVESTQIAGRNQTISRGHQVTGLGFEPRRAGPKPAVLPLHYPVPLGTRSTDRVK